MPQHIAQLSLIVRDYDEAITFYTKKLDFELLEDTQLSESKRWVLVAPKASNGCALLLAKAKNDEQESRIGNQTGSRVFLFLHTDDFWGYYQHLTENNVKFTRQPSEEEYGTVAVFEDLYGNLWDLVQKSSATEQR